jgi:hypothetical protein
VASVPTMNTAGSTSTSTSTSAPKGNSMPASAANVAKPVGSLNTPSTPPVAKPATQGPAVPPFKIESVATKQRYLKMMVYGDFGVGKTYLLGTSADIPQMCDVLFINAEAGDLTFDADEHNFSSIDTIRIREFKQLARVHEFLKLHCTLRDREDEESVQKLRQIEAQLRGIDIATIEEPKRYQTIILDSLTEIEQYCMYQLTGISDTTKMDEEVQGPEWAEYKKQHSMVQRLIRNFRDLPMHILMTCARDYIQDESKRMIFTPQMTGKLRSQVQQFMDLVGFYQMGQVNDDGTVLRRLMVQPAGKFSAKCRFSRYKKPYFDNPTMKSILTQVGILEQAKKA